ncbi:MULTISPECIES: molybdopterin-dependent oxidoreductase [Deinococcus]|uniref:Molybdopterin-dependent oxidoreductase n=1 Tax=Deinococcus rufus TaxID=2136097 RepID=A0ABV7Z3W2_9DEIO|nr:molybdopterin-dependent oxidoreductase [Deinococcus sp. AB2017081]WQE95544.1 hypothetical protein U2P90_01285 [Deinococcus sp. AB2017081]
MIRRPAVTRHRHAVRRAVVIAALAVSAALNAAGAPPIPARPLPGIPVFEYVRPARPLPPTLPGEATVLTVENGTVRHALTLRQLKALPAVRYRTNHLQLRQDYTYEGVTLRDLAGLAGFQGRNIRVYAANGFATTILASDYMHHPIMLAYSADGSSIPVLRKGPLTVVLPARPARFHQPAYSSAWVWFAERVTPAP